VYVRTFLKHAANMSRGTAGASCVGVARTLSGKIAARDSRNPEGEAPGFSPGKLQAFVAKVQAMASDS
jgi:hypothetical protein